MDVDVKNMSEDEVRIRFREALKIFPIKQVEKRMRMMRHDLLRFARGEPHRRTEKVKNKRLIRLARICIDIETGALRWNGEKYFKSKVWEDEPIRPPTVIHRVLFDGKAPTLQRGQSLNVQKMPSFTELFAAKSVNRLPKVSIKR